VVTVDEEPLIGPVETPALRLKPTPMGKGSQLPGWDQVGRLFGFGQVGRVVVSVEVSAVRVTRSRPAIDPAAQDFSVVLISSSEASVKIVKVHGREILDSRGNPTVEVEVSLDGGAFGARWCRPGAPRASAKRSNCATATRAGIWAKASPRRSRT
jgi:hypothetical protein